VRLVAVTSCPTGIAHTFMAAEALEQAARGAGHEIHVETQGAAGTEPLTAEQIAAADVVVFAADVGVRGRARFTGKPVVITGVKRAINQPQAVIDEAVAAAGRGVAAEAGPAAASGVAAQAPEPALTTRVEPGARLGTRLRQWLMTGVSYMIPFVAAGGILIALSFVIGGPRIATVVNGGAYGGQTYEGITDISRLWAETGLAGVMFKMGAVAFSMLVPILSGFIAFAMADRPGLVPGIVGGLLAVEVGAGFLGGLVAGLLAGTITMGLRRIKGPRGTAGVLTVVVVPLVSVFAVGFLMIVVVGRPLAAVQSALTDWLTGLSGVNAWLLGALLGAMMAFDMGGPVNKVAYTFGLAALASGNLTVMAAVMAAGMTPPLAMALATVVRRHLFTPAERQAGEAAWLLGLSFITEGAIPFAAGDPLRVIPSLMAGSAVTGALTMGLGATSPAPHGGIWVIGLVGAPVGFLLALVAGTLVTTGCVLFAKRIGRGEEQGEIVADQAVAS
jgi:PTS system fructose-specific IIC component